jgi:hypothetical protein
LVFVGVVRGPALRGVPRVSEVGAFLGLIGADSVKGEDMVRSGLYFPLIGRVYRDRFFGKGIEKFL